MSFIRINLNNSNIKVMNNYYCYNCGNRGHLYKYCHFPIISNGIICFKENENEITFLMIRRKYTIGYINFIRGQYELNDKSILSLIDIMTLIEKNKLINNDFETLWHQLWQTNKIDKCYQSEYDISYKKFNTLKSNLLNLIEQSHTNYEEQEWGFPKGKREKNECDVNNAIREFEEETNLTDDDYQLLNLKPIVEDFMGTNNKKYRNNYYIGRYIKDIVNLQILNKFQKAEISCIKFMSLKEIKQIIRPYNKEKIKVIESLINSLKFLNNK